MDWYQEWANPFNLLAEAVGYLRAVTRLCWIVAAVTALAACSAPTPRVSTVVYQTRSDTPLNKIEIQVQNDGEKPVTVDFAQLSSPSLAGTPQWNEPVEIPAGAAMDLKVALPEANCGGQGDAQVQLRVDGMTVTMAADDKLGQLAKYIDNDCLRQAVEQEMDMRIAAIDDEGLVIEGSTGEVQVGELGTTILFRPVNPAAISQGRARVALQPNRCDAHALAEDKQGTYFPLAVTLPDGRSGTYTLGVDQQMRQQLYSLYARQCGL
jgi:hypothetical protein